MGAQRAVETEAAVLEILEVAIGGGPVIYDRLRAFQKHSCQHFYLM